MKLLYNNRIVKNININVGKPYEVSSAFIIPKPVEIIKASPKSSSQNEEKDLAENAQSIVEQAKKEAGLIIQEAELEASRIIQAANTESEQIKIAAEQEARDSGYNAGLQEARNYCEGLLQEAEKTKHEIIEEYESLLENAEKDIIEMVISITKKVIAKELKQDKKSLLFIIREAIQNCKNKNKLLIKVSQEDYNNLEEHKQDLENSLTGIEGYELRPDVELQSGSCIIETEFGSIDASVETKMKKMEEVLREASA